jgi:putative DNA primase/helicase
MNAATLAKTIDPRAAGHSAAWSCRCPAHDDQRPSLSIRDGSDGVLLTCHAGCERRDIIAELRHRGLWPRRSDWPVRPARRRQEGRSEPERHDTLAPWASRVWASCRPIEPGTLAARYLDHRGCILPPSEGELRWHPDLPDRLSGYRGPALVALVTDIETGDPINLHRTWLAADGNGKAPIAKPRRLLKGHPSNGVVRLWPDEEVTCGLVIGEGVETCLCAARAGLVPVWATVSAGNLAPFPVLPGLEGLTVLVDHDLPNRKTGKRAGIEAARAVVERYAAAGLDPERDIRVILPPSEGEDAADLEAAA